MTTFDLAGPLPATTTLLEASAGTGKTYAIAALTARYVAEEGLDIGRLLLITFGNHAAAELRARVLARLRSILSDLEAGRSTDPVVPRLLQRADLARTRLRKAIDGFDEATIVTTHSFCQTMLRDLGILGDWDPDETVGPDPLDLVRQCAVDTYLARYVDDPEPPFAPARALRIAEEACTHPLPLLPVGSVESEFCEAVRHRYAQRKANSGVCTFDDVTTRLRDVLLDPLIGSSVVTRLRETYPVVMVDEFQDTDPHQWAIIETAFVAPARPTVLIGDPKQSIYGFRGADLGSYLQAHQHAAVYTLERNYRSDPAAIDGVVELFGDVTMGGNTVRVTPVEAHHDEERLRLPARPGLWLRRLDTTGHVDHRSAGQLIEDDLAEQIHLLCQHAQLRDGQGLRPVGPSDIAVLVRTGRRARRLRLRLSQVGIPTVLTGSQPVWDQPASAQWEALLRAIAEPTQANIRVAALTELIGSPLEELFSGAGQEPSRVSALVRLLARRFASGGLLGVLSHLRAGGLEARLLAEEDGPRTLADLTHVAELLDALGPASAEDMLAHLDRARGDEQFAEPIRLATDEPAVRVMTIHAAKGLEFPIVLLPETEGSIARRTQPFTIVENGRRCLYVGPPPDWRDDLARDLTQQHLDEELRLLYVAMTRAKHLTIAWHAAEKNHRVSPLAALLERHGQPAKARPRALTLRKVTVFDQIDPPDVKEHPPSPHDPGEARTAPWQRSVDQTWRRTSYSGLTQSLHEAPPTVLGDESAEVDLATPTHADPGLSAPSPMAELPAGAAFGTLVHEVFEALAWERPTLLDSARAVVAELAPRHGLPTSAATVLTDAVVGITTTPLLPLTSSSLSDIAISRRLPELDFDLPLADRGIPATVGDLADLLARHLPDLDPFAAYPERLAASEAAPAVLNGFLTGSIDAVLQLDDGAFLVVDYKTNRLGGPAPTLGHYTPAAMAEAMMQSHYPLQAILYCAALHRFLSGRLPRYVPHHHLGGVGYLFVRGMAGPDTPIVDGASCGVMAWHPSADLIVAVSDLLGGMNA